MATGIYTITNVVNGKMYVGLATNIVSRWGHHKADLRNNKHDNYHLQKVYNKYGKDVFKFEILVECEEQYLLSEEHYWCMILDVHNSKYGYNIQPTHPHGKRITTKETRDKISKIHTGKKHSQKSRNLMIEMSKLRVQAMYIPGVIEKRKETIANKYSVTNGWQANTIKQVAKDGTVKEWSSIKQIVEFYDVSHIVIRHLINKTYKISGQYDFLKEFEWIKLKERPVRKTGKRVVQISKNGHIIEIFDSIEEASLSTGNKRHTIIDCCKGRKLYTKGKNYTWKYYDDVHEEQAVVESLKQKGVI